MERKRLSLLLNQTTPNNMQTKNTSRTQNDLIKSTNIPATLVRAVVRQMGGWESFTESASDIASHGIDGGFNGFIHHQDTETFAKRNREAIAQMASQQADDFGSGVIDMVFGFNCLSGRPSNNHDEFMPVGSRMAMARRENDALREQIAKALYTGKQDDDGENVLNALAWYAGEEVARAYVDLIEHD